MVVFLDTEFTNLNVYPRLLSVGIVVEGRVDDDFYAEVTDLDRLQDASAFAAQRVLPQFGRVATAGCRYVEIGSRLCAFFARRVAALPPMETLEVAFAYDLDWLLTALAMKDADSTGWRRLAGRLQPRNVFRMSGFPAGEVASDRYFALQGLATLSRHHALCDARALRIYYEVANDEAATRGGPDNRASTMNLTRTREVLQDQGRLE